MKRMPGRGPGVGEKAKDLVGTWKKLLIYCRKYSAALIVALICAAVGTVLTLVGPEQLSAMTDIVTEGIDVYKRQVSGSVVGAIIGPGFIEGVLGGLIVTGVVSFFDDVENDFNDSLTELYQSLENSESESGIAYIERTYYTNKEGFHTSPIYVDCYYIEWKG